MPRSATIDFTVTIDLVLTLPLLVGDPHDGNTLL